jgi:succinate-acetate transporter protein
MPAVAKQLPWTVCIILCVVCGLGLVFWGIGLLQGLVPLMKLAGWMVFIFGVFLYYAVAAALTNEVYQREVFPLGRPIVK